MSKNEKGITFLPILFFSTLILLFLMGSFPQVLSFREDLQNEWGKLQAEWNAEAGIYLALEAWHQDPSHYTGGSYNLSNGIAQVTVKNQSDAVIEIISIGSQDATFKDKVTALYNTEQNQWIDWMR